MIPDNQVSLVVVAQTVTLQSEELILTKQISEKKQL